ncbi:unnamed protein product [Clonostachys rosea]|uniref:Transmembrane protein n=1 Tax=Bionectria ochroleuca TaxID=29856 RepID=A0ABY6U708_BIOOC|nr:unnamed protein product [Clonostachys rosea]
MVAMLPLAGLLGLALLPNVSGQPTEPQITQAPEHNELDLRQADDLLGWTLAGSQYASVGCSPNSYSTLGNWAACADQRGIPTGCSGVGTVLYSSTTVVCTSPYPVCDTATVMESPGVSSYLGIIRCFQGTATTPRLTYFRTPGAGVSTSSSSSSSTKTTTITKTSTTTSTSTSTTTSSSSEGDVTSTDGTRVIVFGSSTTSTGAATGTAVGGSGGSDSSGGGQNLAWIAGPIIGGLAAIAIVILLIWIVKLLRKRNAEQQNPQQPSQQPSPGNPQMVQPNMGQPYQPYSEAYAPHKTTPTPSTQVGSVYVPELHSSSVVSSELPGSQPSELQGGYYAPQPYPQQQPYPPQQPYGQPPYHQQQYAQQPYPQQSPPPQQSSPPLQQSYPQAPHLQ